MNTPYPLWSVSVWEGSSLPEVSVSARRACCSSLRGLLQLSKNVLLHLQRRGRTEVYSVKGCHPLAECVNKRMGSQIPMHRVLLPSKNHSKNPGIISATVLSCSVCNAEQQVSTRRLSCSPTVEVTVESRAYDGLLFHNKHGNFNVTDLDCCIFSLQLRQTSHYKPTTSEAARI